MIEYRFPNRTVLVTGSSRGIGACILEQFARAGATCVMHYFDDPAGQNRQDADTLTAKLRALGATVLCFAADVRSSDSVQGLMQQIKESVGGLDILVNNAGILRDRSLRKMTLEDWHSVMQTNLDGVFYVCKHAQDLLRDRGRIVNIASVAGLFPFHGQTNYAASKAGVIAITKVLAKELARKGITVNAVAPGVIQTTMLGELKPEVIEEYIKQIPLGRLGRPEDVANGILFLASEESEYITGQVLPITGGWF